MTPDTRRTGCVEDVYGAEVAIGHDCNAVYILAYGQLIAIEPDDHDNFMKLLMQADAQARAWAAEHPDEVS